MAKSSRVLGRDSQRRDGANMVAMNRSDKSVRLAIRGSETYPAEVQIHDDSRYKSIITVIHADWENCRI